MRAISGIVFVLLIFCAFTQANAQATGDSSWGNDETTRSSSFFNGRKKDKASWLKMPKMSWPSWLSPSNKSSADMSNYPVQTASATRPAPAMSKSSKSTTASSSSKIGQTLKGWQTSTKQTFGKITKSLNPFGKPVEQKKTQGYRPQDERKPEKGGFMSWFKTQPVEEINDVNGFLGQPRPRLP